MDPISILTLASSATAVTYQVAQNLYVFINSAKNIDKTYENLASEVTGLRRVLDAISVTLTNPHLRSAKSVAEQNTPIWAALAGSLEDSRKTVESLAEKMQEGVSRFAGKGFVKKSLRAMRFKTIEGDLESIRFEVNTHVNNLQIALQMVNILATSVAPFQAAEAIVQQMESLQSAMERLRVFENMTQDDRSSLTLPPYTEHVKDAAKTLIANPQPMLSDGLLRSKINSGDSEKLNSTVRKIVSEFNRSLYDAADGEEVDGQDDLDSDSDDDIKHEISKALFVRATEKMNEEKYEEAERHFRDAFQHLDDHLSVYDATLERMSLNFAKTCQMRRKFQETEIHLLLLINRASHKPITANVVEAERLLAISYLCQYEFELAVAHCQQAVTGTRKIFGKNHEKYFAALRLLALIHNSNGDLISSGIYLKKARAELADVFNHPLLVSFSGYSQAEHLLMTLAEKQAALVQLTQSKVLNRPDWQLQRNAGREWSTHSATVFFEPGVDSLNISQVLIRAILDANTLLAKWSLSRGADPDIQSNECPVILMGAERGQADVVEMLIKSGADINSTDRSHRSALLWASLWGHESTARVLLKHGAQVDLPDDDNNTPLIDAAAKGQIGVIRLLVEHGAAIEAVSKSGNTALITAANNREAEAAKVLVSLGANVNAVNKRQETALLLAAGGRNDSLITLLINAGADVNAANSSGNTALSQLASSGKAETLKLLLQKGANPNYVNDSGATALHKAIDWSAVENAKILLEYGADASIVYNNQTAYAMAESKSEEMFAVLKKFGVTA